MDRDLLEKIKVYSGEKENGIVWKHTTAENLTFQQLRDSLIGLGKILEEDYERQIYVISIISGLADKNPAVVAVKLSGGSLVSAGYAREGLIRQHTAEKAIAKIEERLQGKRFFSPM